MIEKFITFAYKINIKWFNSTYFDTQSLRVHLLYLYSDFLHMQYKSPGGGLVGKIQSHKGDNRHHLCTIQGYSPLKHVIVKFNIPGRCDSVF